MKIELRKPDEELTWRDVKVGDFAITSHGNLALRVEVDRAEEWGFVMFDGPPRLMRVPVGNLESERIVRLPEVNLVEEGMGAPVSEYELARKVALHYLNRDRGSIGDIAVAADVPVRDLADWWNAQ